MTDTTYILQLPYLNDSGSPICVQIKGHNARSLRDRGTHRILDNGDGYFVVTPIMPAETNVTFQIGQPAY